MNIKHTIIALIATIPLSLTSQAQTIYAEDFEGYSVPPFNPPSGEFSTNGTDSVVTFGGAPNKRWAVKSMHKEDTSFIQLDFATTGYQNVNLSFDFRASSVASKYAKLAFSLDGTNFIDIGYINSDNTWQNTNISMGTLLNDKANVSLRWTATAGPGGAGFVQAGSGSGTPEQNGTFGLDNINITGQATPEPSSSLLLGLASLSLVLRRKR